MCANAHLQLGKLLVFYTENYEEAKQNLEIAVSILICFEKNIIYSTKVLDQWAIILLLLSGKLSCSSVTSTSTVTDLI